jgi:hypothetical protein
MKKKTEERIDLTVVVDRSGSMSELKEEAEKGLNAFFKKQREAAPNTFVTLVQFDTEYEFVHNNEPIAQVVNYSLIPRGCTALLDAVGKAGAEALERFNKHKDIAKKIFVVLTDGHENSSHEWTKKKVKMSLEALKDCACEIIFLGANIDSFAEAGPMGVPQASTANYASTPTGMANALLAVSNNVSSYSMGVTADASFTSAQRSSMTGDDPGSVTLVSRTYLNQVRVDEKLSWAGLERVAGVGNATLKNYADGKTAKLSTTTEERLQEAFPDRFTA